MKVYDTRGRESIVRFDDLARESSAIFFRFPNDQIRKKLVHGRAFFRKALRDFDPGIAAAVVLDPVFIYHVECGIRERRLAVSRIDELFGDRLDRLLARAQIVGIFLFSFCHVYLLSCHFSNGRFFFPHY